MSFTHIYICLKFLFKTMLLECAFFLELHIFIVIMLEYAMKRLYMSLFKEGIHFSLSLFAHVQLHWHHWHTDTYLK